MVLHGRECEITATPDRRGWSLRYYLALFIAALLAVAASAGLAVRSVASELVAS